MTEALTTALDVDATDDRVELTVSLAGARLGATTVRIGNQILVATDGGETELRVDLGSGRQLLKKTVVCTAVIADTPRADQRSLVTWRVSGTKEPFEEQMPVRFEQAGGTSLCVATFYL